MNFQLGGINFSDLSHRTVAIINNDTLYTSKLLRDFKCFHHEK